MEVKGGHVEAARAKKSWIVATELVSQLNLDIVPFADNKRRPWQGAIEDKNRPVSSAVRKSPRSISEKLPQSELEDTCLWLVRWVRAVGSAGHTRDFFHSWH